MTTLVILLKKLYWDYCFSSEINPIARFAISTFSRGLVILNKAINPNSRIRYKINLYLLLLDSSDKLICQSIQKNYIKSAAYISQTLLIDREDISRILFHYFLLSKKYKFGIIVFEELTATDTDNKLNWRALLDLLYYINDKPRLNINFERYLDFKTKQSISDAIDIENNIYLSEYFTYSIGHLTYIAVYALVMQHQCNDKSGKIFISLVNSSISNRSILDSIKNAFNNIVYVSEADHRFTALTKKYENPFTYKIKYKNQWSDFSDVFNDIYSISGLSNLNGLLKLPDKCRIDGLRFLQSYGYSQDDWFVCIHIRERNDKSSRNSMIDNYLAAIHEITRRGGWVIRIGCNGSKPLPKIKNLIDYSQLPCQSDSLDAFFLSECLFSIQNTSGPVNIPILFGKPTIQADCFPIRHTVPCCKDIFIPKLLYSGNFRRLLSFSEVFHSGASSSEIHLHIDGLSVINNTSIEILEACVEMLDKLESQKIEDLSLWQQSFNDLSIENNVFILPQISKFFIEKHKYLLQ